MFGKLHVITDEGALWALAKRKSIDLSYSVEAAQLHRQQHQQQQRL
jgi:hypothetical protein